MKSNVRVRFAPSPTGPLHIGGVRTALYNYLFAKKHQGTFILRIEDTDQTRSVANAEQYIIDSLDWCEIPFDEGPTSTSLSTGGKGDYGPYRQSERKHLYKEYADILIEKGFAYYAFDSSEDLDAHRKQHESEGKTFIYNWHNREKGRLVNSLVLSKEEVQKRIDSGENYVIRFKSPEGETLFLEDEIRGTIKIDTNILDDKVLFKSDGMPTYHLANIVDDHLMEISHVIRGEEWLPSLPLHVLLYRSFGWEAPKFAHLPLILKPDPVTYLNKNSVDQFIASYSKDFHEKHKECNRIESEKIIRGILENFKNLSNLLKINKDKDSNLKKDVKAFLKKGLYGKLSKRDGDKLGFPVFPLEYNNEETGDVSRGYREDGYFSDAFVNMLSLLGWNPGTEQEIFSLDGLVEAFDLKRVSKSGAKFNPDKTKWFNQQYLQQKDNPFLAEQFSTILKEKGVDVEIEYVEKVVTLIKERAVFVADFWELGSFFFETPSSYDPKAAKKQWKENTGTILDELSKVVESIEDFTSENIETQVKAWITEKEIGFGRVMQPLRLSLVGALKGPHLFDIIEMIGKEETLNRIQKIINENS